MSDSRPTSTPQSAVRGLVYVIGSCLLAVVVLAGPAWLVAEQTGVLSVLASAAVCLVPGLLVVGLVSGGFVKNPLHAMLAGTGIRMAFVVCAALVVKFQKPELAFRDFYIWLALTYLIVLAAETLFVSRSSAVTLSDGKGV